MIVDTSFKRTKFDKFNVEANENKKKKKTSLTLRSIKGKIKIVQKDSQQKSYRERSAKDVQD